MVKKYSDALTSFRNLIEKDYKRSESKKLLKEKIDLLIWFVDDCPSKKGPENARKFKEYGIINNSNFSQLKKKIIGAIKINKDDDYRYFSNSNEMEQMIENIENIYKSRRKPIIYFSKGENAEMDSLYIRIRNSFAHGNYFKIRDYYYLWNESSSKSNKKLLSFMVLKYEHLKLIYNCLNTFSTK